MDNIPPIDRRDERVDIPGDGVRGPKLFLRINQPFSSEGVLSSTVLVGDGLHSGVESTDRAPNDRIGDTMSPEEDRLDGRPTGLLIPALRVHFRFRPAVGEIP